MADIIVDVSLPNPVLTDIVSPTQALATNISVPGPQGPAGPRGFTPLINGVTGNSILFSGQNGIIISSDQSISTIFFSGNSGYFQLAVNNLTTNLNSTGSSLNNSINNLSGLFTGYTGSLDNNYATDAQLASTGSNLNNKITSLSGTLTGNYLTTNSASSTYATINNLNSTGNTLNSSINSLSGTLTGNYVTKSNGQFTNRPTVNGTGVLLSGEAAYLPTTILYTTGNQIKSGRLIIGDTVVDPNSPYTLSLQTNYQDTFLEILNSGGAGEGVFFGINRNDFEQYNWQGGDIIFFTSENVSDGLARLTIKNDGKVGIGTSAPSEKLEVAGNIIANNLVYNTGNQIISGVKTFAVAPILSGNPLITGVNLSSYLTSSVASSTYATITNLASTGSTLQTNINNLSNTYATISNLASTGSTLNTKINDFSGYVNTQDTTISNNLRTTGSTLDNKINSLSGSSVLLYGNQSIGGVKTFRDNVYINNLFVTGTETIVSTNNFSVQSPYILLNLTGGAVDGGIFFITGAGLTGINDSGPIIGFDHSKNFKFGISTRNSDLSTLPDIASVQQIEAYSGVANNTFSTITNLYNTGSNLNNKINSLSGWSASALNLASTGSALDSKINSLSGWSASAVNLASTGSTLNTRINNLSGYINSTGSNIVFTTGDQTINGNKNFENQIYFKNKPVISETGFQFQINGSETGYIPEESTASIINVIATFVSASGAYLRLPTGYLNLNNYQRQYLNIRLTGPTILGPIYIQEYQFSGTVYYPTYEQIYQWNIIDTFTDFIDNISYFKEPNSSWKKNYINLKNLSERPIVNGTGVLLSGEAASLPITIVYTTGNQTISGTKIFNENISGAFISGTYLNAGLTSAWDSGPRNGYFLGNGHSIRAVDTSNGIGFYSAVNSYPRFLMAASTLRMGVNGALLWNTTNDVVTPTSTTDVGIYRDAANILAQRNGTDAQQLRIYNSTGINSGEFGLFGWRNNELVIGAQNTNSGILRSLVITGDSISYSGKRLTIAHANAGLFFDAVSGPTIRGNHWGAGDAGFVTYRNGIDIGRGGTIYLRVDTADPTVIVGKGAGSNQVGIGFDGISSNLNSPDGFIMRDGSGILSLRNPRSNLGNSPQQLRIFNITGTNTGEFGLVGWQNNNLIIGSQATNSGVLRNVIITGNNISLQPTGIITINPLTSNNYLKFNTNQNNAGYHEIGYSFHTANNNSLPVKIVAQATAANGRGYLEFWIQSTGGDGDSATSADKVLTLDGNSVTAWKALGNGSLTIDGSSATNKRLELATDLASQAASSLLLKAGNANYINRAGGELIFSAGKNAGNGTTEKTIGDFGGGISFRVSTNTGAAGDTNSLIDRARLNYTGLGLNTLNPQALLDVSGLMIASGAQFRNNVNAFRFVASDTNLGFQAGSVFEVGTDGASPIVKVRNDGAYSFSNSYGLGTPDVLLRRDSAGVLAQRNDANPQQLRIYNRTGTNTGEFALLGWQNNNLIIGAQQSNSGTLQDVFLTGRNVNINASGVFNIFDNTNIVGNLTVSGNTTITGHLSAASKSFLIDHPTIIGKKLQYGSLESPYHGIRLTDKNKISADSVQVNLPDYISALVNEDKVNVQLTNINHDKVLFVKEVNINDNNFIVGINRGWFDKNEYEFYWSFTAERKDIPKLTVEF